MKKTNSILKNISASVFTKTITMLLAFILLFAVKTNTVFAKPLDEIQLYAITADVLDDATVDLTYEIAWEVLDSDSEGPLEWVQIGLPNSHCNEIVALSDTVSSIKTKNSSGTYAVVYFDRKYYKGEVVNFSFKVNMDYMYQVYPEENVAEYTFTPGWFDGITVDQFILRWNSDKVNKFEPAGCLMDGGYHVWTASLNPGEKFTIEMSYPLDAYGFDLSQHKDDDDDGYKYSEHSLIENILFSILLVLVFIVIIVLCFLPVIIPALIGYLIYKGARGFTASKKKEITRTIVEYYPSCPNCGGTREEGKEECSYCGTNMVKSKKTVKEEDIPNEDKGVLKYSSKGEYRYSDNPNRYVRVNVISVPHVVSRPVSHSISRSSGSSHHSSCAHSSCACACACACAGGGRAGCSTKDFYNTNFKLKYLEKYK